MQFLFYADLPALGAYEPELTIKDESSDVKAEPGESLLGSAKNELGQRVTAMKKERDDKEENSSEIKQETEEQDLSSTPAKRARTS